MPMNKSRAKEFLGASVLVLLCVVARLLPHWPNFTPVAACALLAGCVFRSRVIALLVPLVGMGISDLFIGGYEWKIMAVVYASLAFPLVLRNFVRDGRAIVLVPLASLLSSAVFFLATNFAVWSFGGWYSADWGGLLRCYAAAIPFLRYTVMGDLVWSGALFAGLATCRLLRDHRMLASVPSQAAGQFANSLALRTLLPTTRHRI